MNAKVFDRGYRMALGGYPWKKGPPVAIVAAGLERRMDFSNACYQSGSAIGGNMVTKTNDERRSLYRCCVMFSIVLALLVLGGCPPPPPPGPGPGKPDEMQWQHYQMFKSAIDDENKVNALVALDLFEQDISRWYADKRTETKAISELKSLREAVDNEDWAQAAKILGELETRYRPEGE